MDNRAIIIIDDDHDDLELLQDAFKELKVENEIVVFDNGHNFIDYMNKTKNKVFFILCDINLRKMDGIDIKKIIQKDERLRVKCVPFIFLSTSKGTATIMTAYSFNVQGYFIKPNNFEDLKDRLLAMIEYWRYSQHPNS